MPDKDCFIVSSLPDNLNNEVIKQLFVDMKNGSDSARDKIIVHNIRLVTYEVFRRFYNSYETQDLISVGLIGLIKAVDSFDINRNISFSNYAISCIDNEIKLFIKKENRKVYTDSLDRVIKQVKDMDIYLKDVIFSNNGIERDLFTREEKVIIRDLINKLPNREKKIVKLYFGFVNDKRYTQKEIGNMLNYTQSYVSLLLKRALLKLKKYMLLQYSEVERNEVIKKYHL